MKKKLTSLVLALVMCLSLCVPAFATNNATTETYIFNGYTEKITSYQVGDTLVFEHSILDTVTGSTIKIIDRVSGDQRMISTYENGILIDSSSQVFEQPTSAVAPLASPGFTDIDEMYMSSVGLWGTLYLNEHNPTYGNEYRVDYSAGTKVGVIANAIAAYLLPGVPVLSFLVAFGITAGQLIIDARINGKLYCEYNQYDFEVWATNATTNKLGLRTSRTVVYQCAENSVTGEIIDNSYGYDYTSGDTRTNHEMLIDGITNVASGAMG